MTSIFFISNMTQGQTKLLHREFLLRWFSKIYRQVKMTAYVTDALAACNTSKLTSNLQSMSHCTIPSCTDKHWKMILFWQPSKMTTRLSVKFLVFKPVRGKPWWYWNHYYVWYLFFFMFLYIAFEHKGFELILWTMLGLRKIVHHHPLDTDKILFVSNWASFL